MSRNREFGQGYVDHESPKPSTEITHWPSGQTVQMENHPYQVNGHADRCTSCDAPSGSPVHDGLWKHPPKRGVAE